MSIRESFLRQLLIWQTIRGDTIDCLSRIHLSVFLMIRFLQSIFIPTAASLLLSGFALADGPGDNDPLTVRRVPRLGVELTDAQRAPLEARTKALELRLIELSKRGATKGQLLADVHVFLRSVREAIAYQEFFDVRDIKVANDVLDEAGRRLEQLEAGKAPWTEATGLVVRGFFSKLDGSVQPLGLVIPPSYSPRGPRSRLDVWFHGRGETLSEMRFIHQRMRSVGVFQPSDGIVLHPYGRYSNAFKFAGEADTLEAIDFVNRHYHIDEDRTSVRGFSMGGAACWQFAVHYPDRWFAANPGAGFSETPEFLRFFQKETLKPRWWERDLWHWYDCTDWSPNLLHCPTVAYSGELDIQKQAADIMAESLDSHGMNLTHIIGPKTKHRYHPAARDEVARRMASLARFGRQTPTSVRFVTYTLKYNKMHWVQVDGLEQHWKRAEVAADIVDKSNIRCTTKNVTDLTLKTPAGWTRLDPTSPMQIEIDGQRLTASPPETDRSFTARLHHVDRRWRLGARQSEGVRKRHGLQGPIDDALMDAFLFVEPTAPARNAAIDRWTRAEMARAKEHWRRHFRGHAPVKRDTDVRDDDIANKNLILWGDPASNRVIAKIADSLPIQWTPEMIRAGSESFAPSGEHVLLMVYPNPLNPKRYVVLNSSFTYREYAYLNNARQTAKLPDWAVVQLTEKPDPDWPLSRWPGRIVGANFFNEQWQLRKSIGVDHPPDSF